MNDVNAPPAANESVGLSKKQLGKRKMTAVQLELEYAKMPRVVVDSDDEAPRCGTPMHVRQSRAAAVNALAELEPNVPVSTVVPFVGAQHEATEDYAWAADIDMLFRSDDSQRNDARRAPSVSNAVLFGGEDTDGVSSTDTDDIYDNADPDRMVQDPFSPWLRVPAHEAASMLDSEQRYRSEHNMPLLFRDPLDSEHWIEHCIEHWIEPLDEMPVRAVPIPDGVTTEVVCEDIAGGVGEGVVVQSLALPAETYD